MTKNIKEDGGSGGSGGSDLNVVSVNGFRNTKNKKEDGGSGGSWVGTSQ